VSLQLTVNNKPVTTSIESDTPLLWFLREELGLTGTKFGCGIAQCGACTVMLDGNAVRSCVTPVACAAGKSVITIEGLAKDAGHPVQKAWIEEQVVQCGYCQPGQMISTAVLLAATPNPTDEDIDRALSGNICRCGTYFRIRKAVHRAAAEMRGEAR
jgi:aerobic-type carbon monoxide dehydrogenase small subunit (CoxS/CutS family)